MSEGKNNISSPTVQNVFVLRYSLFVNLHFFLIYHLRRDASRQNQLVLFKIAVLSGRKGLTQVRWHKLIKVGLPHLFYGNMILLHLLILTGLPSEPTYIVNTLIEPELKRQCHIVPILFQPHNQNILLGTTQSLFCLNFLHTYISTVSFSYCDSSRNPFLCRGMF